MQHSSSGLISLRDRWRCRGLSFPFLWTQYYTDVLYSLHRSPNPATQGDSKDHVLSHDKNIVLQYLFAYQSVRIPIALVYTPIFSCHACLSAHIPLSFVSIVYPFIPVCHVSPTLLHTYTQTSILRSVNADHQKNSCK